MTDTEWFQRRLPVMPTVKPLEFRPRAWDLVAMGKPVAQLEKGFGISEQALHPWMAIDAVDSGRVE